MKQESNAIKEQILTISREVFRKHGLSKVTMDDIAKACGKSRSTLYYYYKNKMDVFGDLVKDDIFEIIVPASNELKPAKSLKENLIAYNRNKLERLQLKEKEYPTVISDLRAHPHLFIEVTQVHAAKEYEIYKQMLQWGVENEEIPVMCPSDMEFLIKALVTALGALEKEYLLFDRIEDLNSRLDWLTHVLVKGLR